MKLFINGQENTVPRPMLEKIIMQLTDLGMIEYNKLSNTYRVLAKPMTRAILAFIEKFVNIRYGKEASLQFRPARHEDANIFLVNVFSRMVLEGLDKHADITIETDSTNHTATAFSCSIPDFSESGRQMDTGGRDGIGQDNRVEIP